MAGSLDRVLTLELPLIVVVGERQMRLCDVIGLSPGAIIELPKRVDDELELLVNNKPIAAGTAVKVGENFGIRISFIGDLKSRIEAMGAVGNATEKAKAEEDAAAELAEAMLAGQAG